MKRFTTQLVTLAVFLCITGTALATSYRIDFSGTAYTANESYSGYAIVDYSTPDSSSEPNRGFYLNAITHFELQFGSTDYTLDQGDENNANVLNDDDYFGADVFGFFVSILNAADGSQSGFFLLQLVDPTMAVFSSIELPTSLSLADFDQTTNNTYPSGSFVVDQSNFLNPLDSVQVTQVPLPSGLVLLLCALGAFLGRSKHNAKAF